MGGESYIYKEQLYDLYDWQRWLRDALPVSTYNGFVLKVTGNTRRA